MVDDVNEESASEEEENITSLEGKTIEGQHNVILKASTGRTTACTTVAACG